MRLTKPNKDTTGKALVEERGQEMEQDGKHKAGEKRQRFANDQKLIKVVECGDRGREGENVEMVELSIWHGD